MRNLIKHGISSMHNPPLIVDHIDSHSNTDNADNYTWSSVSLGHTTGYLVVGIFSNGGTTGLTQTPTVNGVSTTLLEQINISGNTMGLYLTPVPSSGTATIVVNYGSSKSNFKAALWVIKGLKKLTVVDSDQFGPSTGQPETSVNILQGGCAISLVARDTNTGSTFTWTNAVKEFEISAENVLTGGTTENVSGSTNIGASWGSGTAGTKLMVTASLR